MQIELNLDEMTERYVRSMELRLEAYRARMFSLMVAAFSAGFIVASVVFLRLAR